MVLYAAKVSSGSLRTPRRWKSMTSHESNHDRTGVVRAVSDVSLSVAVGEVGIWTRRLRTSRISADLLPSSDASVLKKPCEACHRWTDRSRGLRRSFKPSPSALKATTAKKMAAPG